MKKISILVLTAALLAFSSTFATFAQASSVEKSAPTVQISEERAAELNRPLIPRGEKIGLLLVFHGSPAPSWAQLTTEIVAKVRDLNAQTPVFAAVEGADMEFAIENDVVAAFERLEKAGCDAIVALPAFIYPTSHVQFDVASILGLYSSVEMRDALKEEGIRTVRSKTPTVVAPTFSSGDLLKKYVLAEARALSIDPKNERLLVVAHGDEGYRGLVDELNAPTLDAARNLGFDDVQIACCEMGQTFAKNAEPIVEKNTNDGKKTLIVAIYLASSAQSFVERLERAGLADLDGLDYELSQGRLGDFDETPAWIFQTATDATLF